MKTVYMDYAATTYVKPEVLEEMMPYFTERFGNPSSFYGISRETKRAIDKARENIKAAGVRANFVHRDFADFTHGYKFSEIVTNMPLRGKKEREEMDKLYCTFFRRAKELLSEDAVIVMYTNESGLVKKHLRLNKDFALIKEFAMQKKGEFNLYIISYKGNC